MSECMDGRGIDPKSSEKRDELIRLCTKIDHGHTALSFTPLG